MSMMDKVYAKPSESMIGAAALTGGLGLAGSLMNTVFQKRHRDLVFAREDSAVQRRVADLRAAGLNPVLAAGSAASAQPMQAPQVDMSPAMKGALMVSQVAQAKADISRTNAQERLLNWQSVTEQRKAAQITQQTAGQRIANEQAMRMNPLLVASQELANRYGSRTLESRVQLAVQEGLRSEHRTELARLETRIANNRELVTARDAFLASLEQVYWQMQNERFSFNEDRTEMRGPVGVMPDVPARLRLEAARIALEMNEKDLNWYTAKAIAGMISGAVGSAAAGARAVYPFAATDFSR